MASNDAWFGGWLPVRASQRLWLVAVLALLVVPLALGVQRWERTFGVPYQDDWAISVQQTSDDGYIVAGSNKRDTTQDRLWLLRLDTMGNLLWERRYCPTGCDFTRAYSVVQTRDEGFVAAGSIGAPDTNPYHNDFTYVIRFDSLGDSLWAKRFGRWSHAHDIEQTRDGGYVVAGRTSLYSGGVEWPFLYVIRLDSLGDSLWSRTLGDSGYCAEATAVKETPDGGFIVAGDTDIGGDCRAWLVRLDSAGNLKWTRTISTGVHLVEVTVNSDGGFTAAGSTSLYGAGLSDYYLVRTDSLGRSLWFRTYGGANTDGCMGMARCPNDGGYVLAGQTWSFGAGCDDAWVVRTDSLGFERWMQTYGGSDWDDAWAVEQTSDEGFIVVGTTVDDAYVIKTDGNGSAAIDDNGESQQPEESLPLIRAPGLVEGQLTCQYFQLVGGRARIELFDASGRRLSRVELGCHNAGWHDLQIPVAPPAGARFLRLLTNGQSATAKFIVP